MNGQAKTIFTSIDLSNSDRYSKIKSQMNVFHGKIYRAFSAKETKKLFCCDDAQQELRILSEEKPDKVHLAKEFGVRLDDVHCYDYTSRLDKMVNGKTYRFKLLGNPVKRSVDQKKLVPLWEREECRNWLLSRSESRGFKVIALNTHFTPTIMGKKTAIHSAMFEGVLEIIDETLFRQTVIEGIGHERGFGFGMLWTEEI